MEGAPLDHDVAAQVVGEAELPDLYRYKYRKLRSMEGKGSFWACLTEEFMNTVHREPRFTGFWVNRPSLAKSSIS